MTGSRIPGTVHQPLVLHVVRRFAVGGLENGLVNLINHMPAEFCNHAIVSLTDHTDFHQRIRRPEVLLADLHKREGTDFASYRRFWRILRELQPDIIHTRNLAGLEYQVIAALAGVPVRIHGEHGRDLYDLYGQSRKFRIFRRCVDPFIHHYTAVSEDLAAWLSLTIGVGTRKVTRIYNGVDPDRFCPLSGPRFPVQEGRFPESALLVGTVGRMEAVKSPLTLVKAFLDLRRREPELGESLRLVMIGDGPALQEARELLKAAAAEHSAWLPGAREDIPEIMRALDVFVLPSRAEGISNTILEAMASGLPVVATRVGGNPELVDDGVTGMLVPADNPVAMAEAIRSYAADEGRRKQHGTAGRRKVVERHSLQSMVRGYLDLYQSFLMRGRQGRSTPTGPLHLQN